MRRNALRDAALALVVVMENGIYFGYGPGENGLHGEKFVAKAKAQQRSEELHALVNLKQALAGDAE